jgi:nucleotide sugar dehydrogenase
MKIAIVGVGVVGNAVYESFKKINNEDIIVYDKYKNIGKIDNILNCQIIFLCLPTLYNDDNKCYDKSAIHEICNYLSNNKYQGLVVIKSTVEPSTTETFSELYDLNMLHNPEFLTSRTAIEDFENQEHIVIGKTSKCNEKYIDDLYNFYKKNYPKAEISLCSSNESELMKLGVNNFYSVKIQFFNELYLLSQKHYNVNFDIVKNLMIKNGWINPMHTSVPGIDGKLSYGGMCFPKDTNALLQHMKKMDTPHCVLEATITERNILRDD